MPEYMINPSDIMIKFTAQEDRVVRVTDKVTDKVTDRVTDRVTDQERQLMKLLYVDPGFTMPVLAEKMGVSRKTIANYLKSLRDKNIIERIGSDRKGYWKIK